MYLKKDSDERLRKLKIGRQIISQLPEVRRQADVAKMLGLTRQRVDCLEARAIFKIYKAFQTIAFKESCLTS